MVHHVHVRPVHRENRLHRLISADRESMVAFRRECNTECSAEAPPSYLIRHDVGGAD
jgi:hypothetical protein